MVRPFPHCPVRGAHSHFRSRVGANSACACVPGAMSTGYAGIAIGFEFSSEELADVFGEQVVEESHMEDRFDQRTGKKVGQVKVVDEEARIVCRLDGKVFESDDWTSFADKLAKKVGCRATTAFEFEGEGVVVIGPRMPNCLHSGDTFYKVSLEGPMPMGPILKFGPELKRIGAALRKLGLKPGKPVVRVCFSCG